MLTTNQEYLNMVNSNIRRRIIPKITVSGKDINGNNVELTWHGSNITSVSYKRGIDPTGQTLPYMELTWKEFYFGKLNENNYPEKYANIVKYMKVDLQFLQNIPRFKTWDNVLNSSAGVENKWSFFSRSSWGFVFKEDNFASIILPTLFLTAKPTIEGHTITWVARDLLSFLNSNVEKAFKPSNSTPFKNPLKWVLLSEQLNFSSSPEVFNAILESARNLDVTENDNSHSLDAFVVLRGLSKDVLKNYANIRNYYLTFDKNGLIGVKKFNDLLIPEIPIFSFSKKIMRNYPKLFQNIGISAYEFKKYYHQLDTKNTKVKDPIIDEIRSDYYDNQYMYAEYNYDGLGVSNLPYFDDIIANKGYYIGDPFLGAPSEITVTPLVTNSTNEYILNSVQGEAYIEDNPINPYDKNSDYIWEKLDALEDWYSSKMYSMEVESLHNVALEMGDLVDIETELYNNSNSFIIKKCIVVGIELEYQGTLKQKTYLHEVR